MHACGAAPLRKESTANAPAGSDVTASRAGGASGETVAQADTSNGNIKAKRIRTPKQKKRNGTLTGPGAGGKS